MFGEQLAEVRDGSFGHFDHWKKANVRLLEVNRSSHAIVRQEEEGKERRLSSRHLFSAEGA
jgi:hypothetical protein